MRVEFILILYLMLLEFFAIINQILIDVLYQLCAQGLCNLFDEIYIYYLSFNAFKLIKFTLKTSVSIWKHSILNYQHLCPSFSVKSLNKENSKKVKKRVF